MRVALDGPQTIFLFLFQTIQKFRHSPELLFVQEDRSASCTRQLSLIRLHIKYCKIMSNIDIPLFLFQFYPLRVTPDGPSNNFLVLVSNNLKIPILSYEPSFAQEDRSVSCTKKWCIRLLHIKYCKIMSIHLIASFSTLYPACRLRWPPEINLSADFVNPKT